MATCKNIAFVISTLCLSQAVPTLASEPTSTPILIPPAETEAAAKLRAVVLQLQQQLQGTPKEAPKIKN